MLQNVMQEQVKGRLVPLEPTLKLHRFFFFFYLSGLLFFISSFFLPEQLRDLFAPEASFGTTSLIYLIITVVKSSQWKTLEKKRQQTTRFIFTQNQPGFPSVESYALPTRLVVSMQRRWSATYIVGTIYTVLALIINGFAYASWQIFVQKVIQHGEAPGWILFGTLLYFGLLCFIDAILLIELIWKPHQQLTVTQDGLLCRRGYRLSYIPWHEVRLFAMIGQTQGTLVYELASGTQVIRWASKPVSGNSSTTPFKTIGLTGLFGMAKPYPSIEEYQQNIQTLNAMITAHTRLPLYDLS